MGKIVITTNMTLDGCVQDPDGREGFNLGGWFGQSGGNDLEEWAKVETAEAVSADALLLGRRSDEWSRSCPWCLSPAGIVPAGTRPAADRWCPRLPRRWTAG